MKNKTHRILEAIETSAYIGIYISIITLLFSSCSQKAWLQRGKSKGWLQTQSDTLIIRDSIFGWNYDTIVQYSQNSITDTLITYNGKDSIVTIVKWKERTLRQIKTEKDTILESKIITNNKVVTIKPKWWKYIGLFAWVFVAGYLLRVFTEFKSRK